MSETSRSPTNSEASTSSSETSEWIRAAGSLKTVVVEVRTLDDMIASAEPGLETEEAQFARIIFQSWDDLHRVLAPNRMAIIRSMTGAGPLSIRELARRVGRDFKGVHSDVTTLVNNGVIDRVESGKVIFPFEEIRVEFAHSHAA